MSIFRITALIIGLTILLTLAGCAKFPSTPPTTGKQLVLTMKVRGRINIDPDPLNPGLRHHYFIAIDNDGTHDTGPWAAIFPPYGGNGWVTSFDPIHSTGLTSFVQYDDMNRGGYVYNILPGSYFLNTTAPQTPIRSEITEGGSKLIVTIDFNQIDTAAIPADQIQQLDINFITTNMLPVSNQLFEDREWDALGSSGQDYMPINTTTNGFFEDSGDVESHTVIDPDLDIIYVKAEVQTVASR